MAEDIAIDLNRGVRMSKDHVTQLEVYMYFDDPGVYLTPQGHPVPEEVARSAGFDVDVYKKAHDKKSRMADFQAMLDSEYGDAAERVVLEERDGYKLVEVGTLGNVMVIDDEDRPLVATPLPADIGRTLFNKLAPPPLVEKPAKAAPAKGGFKPKSLGDDDDAE